MWVVVRNAHELVGMSATQLRLWYRTQKGMAQLSKMLTDCEITTGQRQAPPLRGAIVPAQDRAPSHGGRQTPPCADVSIQPITYELPDGNILSIAHDISSHNTMMRDIGIRKDVYSHVVLSSGTTMSSLDAFHLDDQVDRELTIAHGREVYGCLLRLSTIIVSGFGNL